MGTRDEYVSTVKGVFASIQVNIIMGMVTSAAPIFLNPFLYKLLRHFVEKYVGMSVNAEEILVFFKYIDMRTVAQGTAFYDAATKNKQAQLTGTPEEKQNAEANLMAKLRELAVVTN